MSKSKVDIILHPVRMRIIQMLIGRDQTVQELKERLTDLPQATLYRHLNILKEHEIVSVAKERKIRGAIEKTYTLITDQARLSGKEANKISIEDHKQYFLKYTANLFHQVEAYFEGDYDIEKDGFGYNQVDVYANDDEYQQMTNEIGNILEKYAKQEPRADRRKRTLATILIPETHKHEE
ncbi:helix-turn-helix domain-containing protein [Salicibibacter cibarius]|uniref:Helix-turn-helix domain-containing protein n=1 Tax=Salicibibacter cibarius TaxID=2743000 RepID=A0A7T6Z3Q3_9BACI|nr:helix-turn-helix domain-containing protein [Salicibibacter cibarius]QQK76152.1 helix-turn-helix domain-containing protein [Salicibibacter cibarius]